MPFELLSRKSTHCILWRPNTDATPPDTGGRCCGAKRKRMVFTCQAFKL
jgi:hypothetical protein